MTKAGAKNVMANMDIKTARMVYFDNQLAATNIQMMAFSWCAMFLLFVWNDMCYDLATLEFSDAADKCLPAFQGKLLGWVCNLIVIWRLTYLYTVMSWREKEEFQFQSNLEAFRKTGIWKSFLTELLVAVIYPLPSQQDMAFLNTYVTMLCFARIYLVLRFLRDSSHIYRHRRQIERHFRKSGELSQSIDFSTVWIVYYNQYTILTISGLFFVTFGFLSYCLWMAEREYWNDGSAPPDPWKVSQHGGQLPDQDVFFQTEYVTIGNCLWNVVVTMTTVGYGYIKPLGYQGRVFAGIAVLSGLVQTSMITGVLTQYLNPSHFQQMVMDWIQADQINKGQQQAAAYLLQTAWRARNQYRLKVQQKKENGQDVPRDYVRRHIRVAARPWVNKLRSYSKQLSDMKAAQSSTAYDEMQARKLQRSMRKLNRRLDFYLEACGVEKEKVSIATALFGGGLVRITSP